MSEQKEKIQTVEKQSLPLKNIITPSQNDVLLGRGASTNNHHGNKYFRNVVKQHQDGYLVAKNNFEKYITTMEILKNIRSLNPPGRFILKDATSKLWNDVGDDKSRRKISQALRENATELKKNYESDDSEKSNTRDIIACKSDKKLKRNDDAKNSEKNNEKAKRTDDFRSLYERQNSLTLNSRAFNEKPKAKFLESSQQSIASTKSMDLSLSELEVMLQDFKPSSRRKLQASECNMLDLETSIGTFTINDMSASFGNLSFELESNPVY